MTLGPNPQVDPHSGIVIHTVLAMPIIGNDIVLGEKLTCKNLYNVMNSMKSSNEIYIHTLYMVNMIYIKCKTNEY